jgi:hypothetical protein
MRGSVPVSQTKVRALIDLIFICFGLLIGYAGIQDIHGRGFYHLSGWAVVHDTLFGAWAAAFIVFGLWDIHRAEPGAPGKPDRAPSIRTKTLSRARISWAVREHRWFAARSWV